MSLTSNLVHKQIQTLSLTPQLQQAIKLLELPNVELESYLQQAIIDNPLLSLDTPNENITEESVIDNYSADPIYELSHPDYDNLWTNDDQSFDAFSIHHNYDNNCFNVNNDYSVASISLYQHLLNQIQCLNLDKNENAVALYIIDHLDDAGYIAECLDKIAIKLDSSYDLVESVLINLQHSLEPVGICARDLKECISLQLHERDKFNSAIELLLDNVHLMTKGDLDELMKCCQLSKVDFIHALNKIRECNPKPGSAWSVQPTLNRIPDIFVYWHNTEHKWAVKINEETLPKLYIDKNSYTDLSQHQAVRKYVNQHFAAAQWLMKALEQRIQTLSKVATAIVNYQQDFFNNGIHGLKPLTMKMIADTIEMHESTVSRCVQSKSIASTRGVFDMRYFFSTAIAPINHSAEAHAAETVRYHIENFIKAENQNAPYSDDHLVHLLAQQGINIARRTIAKYREELRIDSSYVRKKRYIFSSSIS